MLNPHCTSLNFCVILKAREGVLQKLIYNDDLQNYQLQCQEASRLVY